MSITELFEGQEPLYIYTRKTALKEGMQVDANIGDFAEVSRQHYKHPVYMTNGVFELMQAAVENPKLCNDWKGVWHDILWMSRVYKKPISASKVIFKVIIAGKTYEMIAAVSAMDIDDPTPVVTIMPW